MATIITETSIRSSAPAMLSELGLSKRTERALRLVGFVTVQDVLNAGFHRVAAIKGVGRKSSNELALALFTVHGIHLTVLGLSHRT